MTTLSQGQTISIVYEPWYVYQCLGITQRKFSYLNKVLYRLHNREKINYAIGEITAVYIKGQIKSEWIYEVIDFPN